MDVVNTVGGESDDGPDLEAGLNKKVHRTKRQALMVASGVAKPSSLVKTVSLTGVSGVGAAASVMSFKFTDPFIVDVASTCTAGFAPYVLHQQHKLKQLDTMEEVQVELRQHASGLKKENETLKASIDEFESKIDRLKGVQDGFEELVAKSNCNANKLISIVKETKKVHNQMELILKARLMQDVLANILRVDRSEDFVIDENEMEILLLRMSMQHGLRFKEERFRKKLAMTDDRSIKTLMRMFRNLLDDNPDDDDQLFSMSSSHLQ